MAKALTPITPVPFLGRKNDSKDSNETIAGKRWAQCGYGRKVRAMEGGVGGTVEGFFFLVNNPTIPVNESCRSNESVFTAE